MTPQEVTVYTRRGCHLCEDLIDAIGPLLRGRASLRLVDIDDDAGLVERYNEWVPVVCVGNVEICRHFLDRAALLSALDSA